ncbi:MAG: hypothetical protein WCE21_02650 [Candidatus Babeliales bacterium]
MNRNHLFLLLFAITHLTMHAQRCYQYRPVQPCVCQPDCSRKGKLFQKYFMKGTRTYDSCPSAMVACADAETNASECSLHTQCNLDCATCCQKRFWGGCQAKQPRRLWYPPFWGWGHRTGVGFGPGFPGASFTGFMGSTW